MDDKLTWWVRDAANSICGQTGATTHQEKLHEAADQIDKMRRALQHIADIAPVVDQSTGYTDDSCQATARAALG